jgi:hypothetical protein
MFLQQTLFSDRINDSSRPALQSHRNSGEQARALGDEPSAQEKMATLERLGEDDA